MRIPLMAAALLLLGAGTAHAQTDFVPYHLAGKAVQISPLSQALLERQPNLPTVSRAAINQADPQQEYPLHYALRWGSPWATVAELLTQGADPSRKNKYEMNALEVALAWAEVEVLEQLWGHPAFQPLWAAPDLAAAAHAAQNPFPEVLPWLHAKLPQLDLSQADPLRKSTPLVAAIYANRAHSVRYLIAQQVPLETPARGFTPLQQALVSHNELNRAAIVTLLLAHLPESALHQSVRNKSMPIHMAAENYFPEILNRFLAAGGHRDIHARNFAQQTPLYRASVVGNTGAIETLLAHGATQDILAADKEGETPLHAALDNQDEDSLTVLLAGQPATVKNALDDQGYSLLHRAALQNLPQMATFLLALGLDPTLKTPRGETALMLAQQEGNREVAAALQGHPFADTPIAELLSATEAGDGRAHLRLAKHYHYAGANHPQDLFAAEKHYLAFHKSASHNVDFWSNGLYGLSLQDCQQADRCRAWFRHAAGLGWPEAMVNLGLLETQAGKHAEAAQWFRQASHRGSGEGAWQLGQSYLHGLGVPRDPEAALQAFIRAAREDHVQATYAVAQQFATRPGMQARSELWLRKAADFRYSPAWGRYRLRPEEQPLRRP
jgi:ankyrin repeat protein